MGVSKGKDYWKQLIRCAIVRALRTTAQTAVALIPVGVSIADVTWPVVLGTAALAGVCSLLTSVAGLPEVEVDGDAE